jgi:hypothetical protein
MNIGFLRFNNYLVLLLVLLGAGCQTMGRKKEASTLRLHVEVNPDGTDQNGPVPIGRGDSSFRVNVETQPFLKEGNIAEAWVVDALGGFQIMIHYDRKGTLLLEQYSTAYKGKRVAIFSQFGEARWLAAPIMAHRIADGTLVFTPDATREEAERIVKGLNNVAKEMQKGNR